MPVPFQHICVNAAISYVVEYSQNKDENKNFYLLGDFEPSLVDFIEQEFAIKKVSIIKVVDSNVKDSIIFFRGFPKEVKIEHFSSDESGNTYFSEHELLNIKYK